VVTGIPSKPFYATNLDPKIYKRTRAVCVAAGVKAKALLEACALDVAVIGNDAAAKVYVGRPAPVAVGRVVVSRGGHDRDHDEDQAKDKDRGSGPDRQ